MASLLAPGVYRERDDQPSRGLATVRTDICGFVGLAERGPLDVAIPCDSWEQFETTFGSFMADGYLAYAAKAFFENGGRELVAVRVAAPEVVTMTSGAQPVDGASSVLMTVAGFAEGAICSIEQQPVAGTTGPQPPDRRSSIVTTVEGFPQGALVLLEQMFPSPRRAFRRVAAVASAPARLWWNMPLETGLDLTTPISLTAFRHEMRRAETVDPTTLSMSWDAPLTGFAPGGPPLQVATGAGNAGVELFDANAVSTMRVLASSPGAWGNRLAVRVTQTARATAIARGGVQPPGGLRSVVSSVVGLAPGTLVRLYQPGLMGEEHRIITAVDAGRSIVTWDAPLPAAYDATKDCTIESVSFGIVVLLDSRVQEVHAGLSLDRRHSRYVEAALAGSRWIRATDLVSASPYRERLPDPGSGAMEHGVVSLRGGRDGLAALRPVHLTGDPFDTERQGLRLFEEQPDVSQLAIPDVCIVPAGERSFLPPPPPEVDECLPSDPPTPVAAPRPVPRERVVVFDDDDIFGVQERLIEHCRRMGDRVALLDPPPRIGAEPSEIGEIEAWRARFDSSFAALFYPWIVVVDPRRGAIDHLRTIPPSGHVAGIIARVDRTAGVHKAPANEEAQWAQAPAILVEHSDQEELNPRGVDCFRALPGRRLRLYGARTMSEDPSWRDLNVRRLTNMIKRSLFVGTQWAVFEPNDDMLRERIRFAITGLFEALWERGALVGASEEQAFVVRSFDDVAAAETGRAMFVAAFAPSRPAEFVVLRVGRTQDELRITEEI